MQILKLDYFLQKKIFSKLKKLENVIINLTILFGIVRLKIVLEKIVSTSLFIFVLAITHHNSD